MGLKTRILAPFFVCLLAATASAAPQLRLAVSALGPFVIAQGANGAAQSVDASNAGDGSLNLTAASSATWLGATIGQSHTCSLRGICIPVQMTLQTSSLTAGTYTGTVTVSDPNAIDAPQTITVTVQIGSNVPSSVDLYVAPNGGTATSSFTTPSQIKTSVSTSSGGSWLSVALGGNGSFAFAYPYQITGTGVSGLGAGNYTGSVAVSNSTLAGDNKTVQVTLHVTTQPIAEVSPASIQIRAAQGGIKQTATISLVNLGQGTLSASSVTATAASGTWLSAATTSNGSAVTVTADPASLTPNLYTGTVAIATNGANGTVNVPVTLNLEATGPPLIFYQSAVNNATFVAGDAVAPGDIMAVFGDQFSTAAPGLASVIPLATTLNDVQVMVNGKAAPLYYSSYQQIDFQLPYETPTGLATVQVVRGGQAGNLSSIQVGNRNPRILQFGGTDYGIIQNQDGTTFAVPASVGVPNQPAAIGKVIVMYAIGLGQTAPAATTGAAATSSPNQLVTPTYKVCFGGALFNSGDCILAQYSGLTPTFVGLYQVNVQLPSSVPRGTHVPLYIDNGEGKSNVVYVSIAQ